MKEMLLVTFGKGILLNLQVNKYILDVNRHLICSAKTKKNFTAHLKDSISAFVNESPDCTMEDIIQFSGPPETLAQDFMETLDEKEIRQGRRNRRIQKIVGILLIVCIIAILIEIIYILYLVGNNSTVYITEVRLASIPD